MQGAAYISPMSEDNTAPDAPETRPEDRPDWKSLPPAAQRALKEAADRKAEEADKAPSPKEYGGRDGPEPVRFGDWEKKGIAIDF